MEPNRVVRRVVRRAALAALLASIAACSLISRGTFRGDPPASAEQALRRFAHEVHLAHVDRRPDLRARLGLPWVERWLARRDPDRVAVERQLLQRELDVLANLHPRDRLAPPARLEWRLLADHVRGELEALDWGDLEARPHPRRGPHLALLRELGEREVRSESDVREWIVAASRTVDSFDRLALDAKSLADADRIAPSSAYAAVAGQCRAAVSGFPFRAGGPDAPLFAGFRARLLALSDLDVDRRALWLEEARNVLREDLGGAIEGYAATLGEIERSLEEDRGVWALPDGEAYYVYRVSRACGIDTPVDEVEQRVRELVATSRTDLGRLARQLDHPGTLTSFLAFVREDTRFRVPDDTGDPEPRAVLTAGARRLVESAEAAEERVLRLPPWAPLAIEPIVDESLGPEALYETYVRAEGPRTPARWRPDFSNPAAWPRPRLTVEVHRWSWPGRHLRESVLAERSDLATFRRHLLQPAWAGGWDLYALRVAEEVGLADDPYDRVARLGEELWASALALADFGIHSRQWTPSETRDWLVRTTARPAAECAAAVRALLLDPGDATAAAWGLATILAQRERAEDELGSGFDLRAFHAVVIGDGPMPPVFIEAQVTAWLEEQP